MRIPILSSAIERGLVKMGLFEIPGEDASEQLREGYWLTVRVGMLGAGVDDEIREIWEEIDVDYPGSAAEIVMDLNQLYRQMLEAEAQQDDARLSELLAIMQALEELARAYSLCGGPVNRDLPPYWSRYGPRAKVTAVLRGECILPVRVQAPQAAAEQVQQDWNAALGNPVLLELDGVDRSAARDAELGAVRTVLVLGPELAGLSDLQPLEDGAGAAGQAQAVYSLEVQLKHELDPEQQHALQQLLAVALPLGPVGSSLDSEGISLQRLDGSASCRLT